MTLSITTLDALRQTVEKWRKAGDTVALVPTMGALHRGHLALVEAAQKQARRVVVSIFVNPTQFGPKEDFSRYPRPIEKDLALLEGKADAVWLPSVEVMYPHGAESSIHISGISSILEGAFRPGHFDGVATVVATLFAQVTPDVAFFGEKDYQQLCLVKRLVSEYKIPVAIIGVPIVREADGLALSSRNQYLSADERSVAPALYKALSEAAQRIKSGQPMKVVLNEARQQVLDAGFKSVDYIAFAAEDTLNSLNRYAPPARLLAAAHLGKTRLIDNVRLA